MFLLLDYTAVPDKEGVAKDSNPEVNKYFPKVYEDSYSEIKIYKVN